MMRKVRRLGRARLLLMLSVAGLAGIAVTQVISASAGTGAASAPAVTNPFAAYVPPSGPELPPATILSAARSNSAQAGVTSPSAVSIAQGSLREVMTSVNPEVTLPAAPGGGQEAWLNSTVDLVSMHGSFTLYDAHVPHGQPAPTGSVLDLMIDAHTGQIVGRTLTTTAPSLQRLTLMQAESTGATAATATGVISGRLYAVGGPAPGHPRPAQAFTVLVTPVGVSSAGAGVLAATRTAASGWFAIRIRPGRYQVAGRLPSGLLCPAQKVLVRAAETTRTRLTCSIR